MKIRIIDPKTEHEQGGKLYRCGDVFETEESNASYLLTSYPHMYAAADVKPEPPKVKEAPNGNS